MPICYRRLELSFPLVLAARETLESFKGFILGNDKFSFLEPSLDSWLYPIDLEFTLKKDLYYFPRDSRGLPMRRFMSVGDQYVPTRIASYALAHHNRYLLTGDEHSRQRFFAAVEWFMSFPEGVWYYNFSRYGLKPPWVSAMAQGEGISVLVRAWKLSQDSAYLSQAQKALKPLLLPLERGGVRSELPDGSPFLEEYPTNPPLHVLNGFMYTLIGLVDLGRVSKELVAPVGLDDLLDSLDKNISLWDFGSWSLYDLGHLHDALPHVASMRYHNLHISQLTFLGRFTHRQGLLEAARRWKEYARSPWNRWRAFFQKVRYRLKALGEA